MIYRVTHTTVYSYVDAALTSHNQLHLTPRDMPNQRCLGNRIAVEPTPRGIAKHTDYFGNIAANFEIDEPHERLSVTATSKVEVTMREGLVLADAMPWEQMRDHVATDRDAASTDAFQFVFPSPYVRRGQQFSDYARQSFTEGRPVLEAAMDLTTRINTDFKYDPKATNIATSLEDVFEKRHGVCQDFAHAQLACLRSLGLPARYVSGYLRTIPPEGKKRLVGADASHAWIDVYAPSIGWIGFDPTNNCIADDRHVIVAVGRDYGDVSPIKGVVLGSGDHQLTVTVDVAPLK